VGDYRSYQFDFEKLDVYRKSIEFTNEVFSSTLRFKREIQYSLGDQFRRAALSICNNLAEGSRKSAKHRAQFYHYALDSARECIPMITVAVMQGELAQELEAKLRGQAVHICNMIYRLIQSSS
jgi:four helix bundle protein